MNTELRMARAISMDAKLAMKINKIKDRTRIDRRETSFSGSYLDRTGDLRRGKSVYVPSPRHKEE